MTKQNYELLISKFRDDEDMLDFIKERMQKICGYVESVTAMEYSIPIIRARYEGQDLIDKIQKFDNNRHIAHEAAIASVKQLNRLCVSEGVSKLFDGDETDRYQIADFCMLVVNTLFEGRTR